MASEINPKYVACEWVSEGMEVWAPVLHEGKHKHLKCVVTIAAGFHAYVENAAWKFAKWFDVRDLFRLTVPEDVGHTLG